MDAVLSVPYMKFYNKCQREIFHNVDIPLIDKNRHVQEMVDAKIKIAEAEGLVNWLPTELFNEISTFSGARNLEPPIITQKVRLWEEAIKKTFEKHILSMNEHLLAVVPQVIEDINYVFKCMWAPGWHNNMFWEHESRTNIDVEVDCWTSEEIMRQLKSKYPGDFAIREGNKSIVSPELDIECLDFATPTRKIAAHFEKKGMLIQYLKEGYFKVSWDSATVK